MKKLHALMLGVGAALVAAPALAQEPITLKISYQFPEHHFVTLGCINPFIEGVEKRVPGKVTFQRFPAEQLAKAFNQLDSVRNRIADISIHNAGYTPQLTPLTTFLELPGMYSFDDTMKAQRAFEKLAKDDLAKTEYAKIGVVPVWVFVTSPYQFQMVTKEPTTSIDQLRGKKLRVPGAGAEMALSAIDAVGVRVPASDLYLALQRGTVDGSIISTQALPAYKLDEVLGSMSTNASWGGSPFIAPMRKDRWDALPDDVRQAISEAGHEAGEKCVETYMRLEIEEHERLRKLGKTVFALPEPALKELDTALQPVVDNWLAQMDQRSLDGKAVIAKFKSNLAAED
ncbi:TRAP transporter substrate-binding protein DctP [Ancylobacter mangrovi]|uniref:TRAP transporter substrate-binding protein DctP n=1 Tax=Ancylobacter mangrovi TaxID=2972472 RepID=UPI00216210F0|nr:TRAP transporter substrate-binding protein DctP [Ancylobacter mangrovi]MCS0500820.1 TRAP transporter substrate-binding protein DctP [Ancylobacter mangrovi]